MADGTWTHTDHVRLALKISLHLSTSFSLMTDCN